VGNKYNWAVGVGPCFKCELEKECYPPEAVGPCPECDGSMFLISFKDSRFLGCTKRCGYTHSVPKTGKLTLLDKTCETCGWKLFRLKADGEGENPEEDICVNRRCTEGIQYWKKAGPRNEARLRAKSSAGSAATGPETGSAARKAENPVARKVERPAPARVSKAPSVSGSRKESK